MNAIDRMKQIAASNASGGGNWIRQGSGVLVLRQAIYDGPPRFYRGDTFLAEMFVESSADMPGAVDEKGLPEKANAPGSSVTYVQGYYPPTMEVAPGNTKAFLLPLWGLESTASVPEEEYVKSMLHTVGRCTTCGELIGVSNRCTKCGAAGAQNPLKGTRVRYETYMKVARGTKKRLVLVKWSAWKENQNAEDLADGISAMEGGQQAA